MLIGSVLLWSLLILLALLLLLLLLVLFMPFRFHGEGSADLAGADWEDDLSGTFQGMVRFRWGVIALSGLVAGEGLHLTQAEFRLMGFRMNGRKSSARRRPGGGTAPRQGRVRKRPRRWRARPNLPPDLLWALAKEAMRLPGQIWRSLGVDLSGDITYGFSDPSLTGWCEATRWGTGKAVPIKLTADFLRPCLIGWATVGGRVYGFRLAAIGWRVLRRPVIWNHLVGNIRFRPLRSILMQGGS